MKKKSKKDYYTVTYSTASYDRHILIMLKAIGKYLSKNAEKLLKAKPAKTNWNWEKKSK